MFSQFFFIALYMQNILHYSPLAAGIRFLPATVLIIVMGPLAGRLTDRVGPRPLVTAGMLTVAAAVFIQSHITVHTGYLLLLPGFVLMGIGMGLVMSPMSTAAMNAVDRTKAGVASGVLSMSRMVGGTVGLAVMGALITAIGRAKIDERLPHVPAATRAALANTLGGGGLSGHHASAQTVSTVREAFVSALSTGLTVGAAVTLVGAVLGWTFIERLLPAAQRQPAEVPELASDDAAPELTAA
jgi:MFS family permease